MLSGWLPDVDPLFPFGRHHIGKGEFSQSFDYDYGPEQTLVKAKFLSVVFEQTERFHQIPAEGDALRNLGSTWPAACLALTAIGTGSDNMLIT